MDDFFTQQLLNYFSNQNKNDQIPLDELYLMLAAQSYPTTYPQQTQLPPGWMEWLLKNWQMMGSTRPEYKTGAEDRAVGLPEEYRLKIPTYKPDLNVLGTDKMIIPRGELHQILQRIANPNRRRWL